MRDITTCAMCSYARFYATGQGVHSQLVQNLGAGSQFFLKGAEGTSAGPSLVARHPGNGGGTGGRGKSKRKPPALPPRHPRRNASSRDANPRADSASITKDSESPAQHQTPPSPEAQTPQPQREVGAEMPPRMIGARPAALSEGLGVMSLLDRSSQHTSPTVTAEGHDDTHPHADSDDLSKYAELPRVSVDCARTSRVEPPMALRPPDTEHAPPAAAVSRGSVDRRELVRQKLRASFNPARRRTKSPSRDDCSTAVARRSTHNDGDGVGDGAARGADQPVARSRESSTDVAPSASASQRRRSRRNKLEQQQQQQVTAAGGGVVASEADVAAAKEALENLNQLLRESTNAKATAKREN